mmetsp:Transcript_9118/g.32341  ORF Transcript_9118/g.32341 Transcript_9118/m.32341 type:complete len:80 (-) Transcript_9118:262-501(-)
MFFMPLVETSVHVHLCPFVEDSPLFGSTLHAGTQARDELRQAVGVGGIFFRGRRRAGREREDPVFELEGPRSLWTTAFP